jgi:amino acid adenylation domain-containing protein
VSVQSASSPSAENNSGSTLPEMLLEEARRQPDACAIVAGEDEVSFGQLVDQARSLSSLIGSAGIAPDETVGIFAEPGAELPLLVWGALFSGAAYLPLATDYPDDRLRYMLENSGTRLVLTQPHLIGRILEIAPDGTQVLTLNESRTAQEAAAPAPATSGNLAYCIYTSGSTGRPKGVMIEHRSAVAQLRWLRDQGHLQPGVRILQKTPMSFDAAQWEILAPAAGATAVMGAPELYRNPYGLVEMIARHEVTHLQCVPTLLQALLETEGFDACTSLQSVYCGGEALSKPLAKQFLETLPGSSLTNMYGPTETTINALAHTVTGDDLAGEDVSVPIGAPVPGIRCVLLDEDLNPVPDGEPGDLYLGGIQLARGYMNNPDQTAERFIQDPAGTGTLYKSGDVVRRNADGLYYFQGRSDNQVKLRGYRVELEEIASAVEHHQWVRRAAAVVTTNVRTGNPELVACVEMNPTEAALMDQGSHGAHHQTKQNKLQVKAQLSNPGIRSDLTDGIELPGRDDEELRAAAFARKTYRFYDGGPLADGELQAFLAKAGSIHAPAGRASQGTLADLGYALRWIGQFQSPERLLPKYSYASPGALYGVQTYLELQGQDGIADGIYYYHPELHRLQLTAAASGRPGSPGIRIHVIGKTSAIEPVYKNNILEVLEFEAGHLMGALQDGLAPLGRTVAPYGFDESVKAQCGALEEDHYLGTFAVVEGTANHLNVDVYVNIPGNKVPGVAPGTYQWNGADLEPVSTEVIQRKHVIAINQRVFDRSSFGISAVAGQVPEWLRYATLGCYLHRVQRNGAAAGLGFMSSGYSSKSGNTLPASWRLADILKHQGKTVEASYFFIGGKISAEQIASEGMNEDLVHMQGPAEMVREELEQTLPDYMVPHRTVVFNELPLTPNGKVDLKALAAAPQVASPQSETPFVPPSTPTEKRLAVEWAELLKYDDVSVQDDFFAVGGNSLMSITLISRIGRIFGVQLPLRALIDAPVLADLAQMVDQGNTASATSRFIPLNQQSEQRPVYCWPGLGGYPMNLMKLAGKAVPQRPFFGIQAQGINAGETAAPTIQEMASADIAEMLKLQPEGPYTLWGYSFGARVAFEAAWQLEQAGKTVDRVMLICPGNPRLRESSGQPGTRSADFTDPAFVTVLGSVFLGTSVGPQIDECVDATQDRVSFVEFIQHARRELALDTINRITDIVVRTFEFEYTFSELLDRRITAPISIFKAAGDDYSFIESAGTFAERAPRIVTLSEDHYAVLQEQGVDELASALYHATYDPSLDQTSDAGASASPLKAGENLASSQH